MKISTLQLVLLSTGGIIGAGWLFSPFYGFQTAGVGVLLSWLITILLTGIIAFSFAEVSSILPIIGGISRFIGVTHNRTLAFMFLSLSWISYVVYLPIEAQSAIQYLGFFFPNLVKQNAGMVGLSLLGLNVALCIIIGLTWFNCMVISTVAKANSIISIWKLFIPLGVALFFISIFGKWEHVTYNYHAKTISFENILLAITSNGLAFAFAGFQNGLVLSNAAENPKQALPYSLFVPILLGGFIYFCLSLAFIACLPNPDSIKDSSVAPLLSLVALFGINTIYVVLFVDAVIAPLGTANVFTASTARVLYGIGREFMPNSILVRLNKHSSPYIALWISAAVGACFLLPLPTWKELVNFLSSVTVFAYLSGPITLIILRNEFPDLERNFRTPVYRIIGYAGFCCCSLFIYWSELANLRALTILSMIVIIGFALINKNSNLIKAFKEGYLIVLYLLSLTIISYIHYIHIISFPYDNLCVVIVSILLCKSFICIRLNNQQIKHNLAQIKIQMENENAQ